MTYKEILKIAPTLQASALAMDTAKLSNKKQIQLDDQLHSATKVLVGSSLIGIQNNLIDSL